MLDRHVLHPERRPLAERMQALRDAAVDTPFVAKAAAIQARYEPRDVEWRVTSTPARYVPPNSDHYRFGLRTPAPFVRAGAALVVEGASWI